jgi:hypothetical protein
MSELKNKVYIEVSNNNFVELLFEPKENVRYYAEVDDFNNMLARRIAQIDENERLMFVELEEERDMHLAKKRKSKYVKQRISDLNDVIHNYHEEVKARNNEKVQN